MPTEITGSQKRQLRALAQKLEPLLKVGKNGLSPAFVNSTEEMLERHELVKIRFAEFKDERRDMSAKLAEATDSHLVAMVGHVIVLYREHPLADQRKFKLK